MQICMGCETWPKICRSYARPNRGGGSLHPGLWGMDALGSMEPFATTIATTVTSSIYCMIVVFVCIDARTKPVYSTVSSCCCCCGFTHSHRCLKPNTHRRRRCDSTVQSRRVGSVYMNSQLAHDDCRICNLETEYSGLTAWILLDIGNFFDSDVIMSSLVTNLNSSTAQEIVNWVSTVGRWVHTADTTQLDFAVGKFVQTHRDCRQLVANSIHCRRDSTQQLSRVGIAGVY